MATEIQPVHLPAVDDADAAAEDTPTVTVPGVASDSAAGWWHVVGEICPADSSEQVHANLVIHRDGTVETCYIGQDGRDVHEARRPGHFSPPVLRQYLRCALETGKRSHKVNDHHDNFPNTMRALLAREAVLQNDQHYLRDFSKTVLGFWSGWDEAVSTALLGHWADPLTEGCTLGPDALDVLRGEIRTVHQQLQPIWRRRTGGIARKGRRVEGQRILLLETPCGEQVTLRDVLAGACPEDPTLDLIPADPRLARILAELDADERAVVLALGLVGIGSWTEAAEYVGADDPPTFGERVRRKARRLAAKHKHRHAPQSEDGTGGLWHSEGQGTSS